MNAVGVYRKEKAEGEKLKMRSDTSRMGPQQPHPAAARGMVSLIRYPACICGTISPVKPRTIKPLGKKPQ